MNKKDQPIQRDLFYIATSLLADLNRAEAMDQATTTVRKLIQLHEQGYTLSDFAEAVMHAAETAPDQETVPDQAP